MLKLPKHVRDQIVRFCKGAVVAAPVGAALMQIADILSELEEIKEDAPVVDAKAGAKSKA